MRLLLLATVIALTPTDEGGCGGEGDDVVVRPPPGDDVDEGPRACEAPSLRFSDAATWPDGGYGLWGVAAGEQHWGCTFKLRGGEVDLGWNGCAAGADVFTQGESLYFVTPPALGARFRLIATYDDEPFLSDVWVEPLAGSPCELGLADVPGAPQ